MTASLLHQVLAKRAELLRDDHDPLASSLWLGGSTAYPLPTERLAVLQAHGQEKPLSWFDRRGI